MTVEEKLMGYLVERGMSPEGAGEVLEAFKAEVKTLTPGDNVSLGTDADKCPRLLYDAWEDEINHHAVLWIDANCPHAWYRPMFAKGN